MSVFTYLLKSEQDNTFYTGISADPNRRLAQHNKGSVEHTKKLRPWKLVYKKQHDSYEEARKHERWLKKKNQKDMGGIKNLPKLDNKEIEKSPLKKFLEKMNASV